VSAPSGIVSLLTDFGLQDPFVGILKGVILREAPSLSVVDLSHGVPPQDLDAAAFYLAGSFPWFPEGTVHLCVVDPGVGTARAALAMHASGHYFVAPDNGVLAGVIARDPHADVRRVEPERLGINVVSRTFHGRDVFAPIAAQLASGRTAFESIGDVHEPVQRVVPRPSRGSDSVSGRVIVVDHFGNLITNVPGAWLREPGAMVEIGDKVLRIVPTYVNADPGECVGVVSSFDTLEIARRDGSAAQTLRLGAGTPVRVVWRIAA
jgi:S-adenosylmethionine hydrolase